MRLRNTTVFFALSIIFVFCGIASGQGMASMAMGGNAADMKFVTLPPLPTCAKGSVASGNPTSGPSIIVANIDSGCVIAWHWHTPIESVMIASGTGRMEMRDGKSMTLTSGGVAIMPANNVHQFTCVKTCTIFIHSNVAFDIHYVDKQGKEITPAEALKAVKENPATEMK